MSPIIYWFIFDEVPPQLFIIDRSKAVLLWWFKFIQVIPIMCFLLHDFVATRIFFGCSLSPLHFLVLSKIALLPPYLQQLLILLSVIHVLRWYLCIFSQHDFLISCLYLCITEPLQKLRARLGAYKTGLSPPVTLCY